MDSLPANVHWYFEKITPELFMAEGIHEVIYSGQTAYQKVEIIETGPWGRSLVIDGRTQSSTADEWVYHEALVQPSMLAHPDPKRVFIAGGGEGATAREVLRHQSVTEVVMVDLDEEVVELCKEHLVGHHKGAFEDRRMTLLHENALAYLEREKELFDIIVIDVPDPLESGPAYLLFTQEFYRLVAKRLAPGGLMVAQSGPAGPTNVDETLTAVHHTVASVFTMAQAYSIYMPSFGTQWGFVIGVPEKSPDVAAMDCTEIDSRLSARIDGVLRYYDGLTHRGIFSLPKYIREGLSAETRLITYDNPLYAD